MKTPARFKGKEVTTFKPQGLKHTAAILVDMKEFHMSRVHAGQPVQVAREANGDLFGIADAEGNEIPFIHSPFQWQNSPKGEERQRPAAAVN